MADDEWGREDRERLVRVEEQLNGMKAYVEARLNSIDKSTSLAATSLEKRLESMNEVRAQLKDQAMNMIPRQEFELQHSKVCDDIKSLRESRSELKGKADQSSVNWAQAVAVIALLVGAFGIIAGIWGH